MPTPRLRPLALALALLPAAALAQRGADEPAVVTLRLGDTPHPIPGPLGADGERVQIGGRRAERADGRWRFSDDRVLQQIRAAAALDGRFVFVTEDGLVAASDTFVGPLRPLGAVPGARRASSWTRGRLAVLADDAFFTTDGASLTPAGATPAPARHAAFLDARTGAAVLADGRLVFTRDGAATWAPVDLGRDLALLVAFREGALQVFTTRGALALSAAGALSPVTATTTAPRERRRVADVEALTAAWRAREPVPDHGATPHARLPDGTFVAVDRGSVRHVDASGRVLSLREMGPQCTASSWPGGVGVACGDLYRTTDGETWEAIPGPPAAPRGRLDPVAFASDGAGVALIGQCEGDRFEADARALCVRDARGRWRDLSRALPTGGFSMLRGMRAGDVLVERAGPEGGLFLVDVAAGSARRVTFDGVPAEGARVDDAHLADDGAYVAVVRTEREAWYARGAEGAAWTTLPLPQGVAAVAFADARRGVALGDRLERLWRTLDGGARWEPLPTGVTYHGEAPRIVSAPEVRCDARGCSIGGFLFVRGWGPAQAPRERIYGGARRPDDRRRSPEPYAPLRCAAGAAGASRRLNGRVSSLDHGASVARSGDVVTLSWRGADGRGEAIFPAGERDPFDAVLGFHAGALVSTGRDLAWARGRTVRPLGLPRVARTAYARSSWLLANAPGGGLVALAAPGPEVDAPDPDDPALQPLDVQVAFEVTAAGAVARRRAAIGDPVRVGAFTRGLARVGARWGIADVADGGAVRFAPLDGGAPAALGTLSEALRPCAAPAPRDAALVRFGMYAVPRGIDEPRPERARVDVELAAGGACLREVAAERVVPQRPGAVEYVRLRAEAGALVGDADDGERRQALRCEVTP